MNCASVLTCHVASGGVDAGDIVYAGAPLVLLVHAV